MMTADKIQERIKIKLDVIEYIPKIYADYGFRIKEYRCNFGDNNKAGMNTPEYIRHTSLDYTEISDERIMLKVDSGIGRSDKEFLAWWHIRGIIILPAVPNTSAVSQVMDQSYGGLQNRLLCESCFACGAPLKKRQCFRSATY